MNSYDFMQKINRDMCNISQIFDSTMALYEVIGCYDGLSVINSEKVEAVMTYTVSIGSEVKIEELLRALMNSKVTVYDTTYSVSCNRTKDKVMIALHAS